MTERKQVCISLTDEIIKMLEAVEKETGLKKSVVIQELIRKAYTDQKTREIITKENYKRVLQKKMGSTTHNDQCDNSKENGSPEPYPEEPGCPAKGTFSSINQYDPETQRRIKVAKGTWGFLHESD